MNKAPIPEVGKTYKYFDDGKVRYSRMFEVKITEVIPFANTDQYLCVWKHYVEMYGWIYAKETDYFVLGYLERDSENTNTVFVRTVDGGWFSIGFWGGRLDIDGSLYGTLKEFY